MEFHHVPLQPLLPEVYYHQPVSPRVASLPLENLRFLKQLKMSNVMQLLSNFAPSEIMQAFIAMCFHVIWLKGARYSFIIHRVLQRKKFLYSMSLCSKGNNTWIKRQLLGQLKVSMPLVKLRGNSCHQDNIIASVEARLKNKKSQLLLDHLCKASLSGVQQI